jgi:limonene-1,2-epoxide hydrolase
MNEVNMKQSKHRMTRRAFAASGLGTLSFLGVSSRAFAQVGPQVDLGKPVTPEVEKANVVLVNDFCAAFEAKDLARLVSLLADNVVYRITQARSLEQAAKGKDAVAAIYRPLMDRGEVSFKVLKTVSLGPIVLNERNDFLPGSPTQPARILRVHAGMFFVQDGKIVEWTDYRLQ